MSEFLSNVLGEVAKLEFIAYSDSKFEKPTGKNFIVQFNPADFSTSHAVKRGLSILNGQIRRIFMFTESPDISLEFTLDGTGASPTSLSENFKRVDITKKVKDFLDLCYEINSDIHEPNYIIISYGNILFKTVFKSCDIKYTLFKSDGTPLRAKVSAKFINQESVKFTAKKLGLNSPDVTHKRTIKDSDTLTAMAEKIYERNDLYQDIAAFNNLNSFRRVKTGTELFFPPLKK
jgi:hypothetical protein